MKEAIGSVPLYNFIILFIVIAFGFLAATVTYFKAFKLNSSISFALEKFEGLNSESIKEINDSLEKMGYRKDNNKNCPNKAKMSLVSTSGIDYPICIYESGLNSGYFNYGITTFIYLDMPIVGLVKIPIYTESEKLYRFN